MLLKIFFPYPGVPGRLMIKVPPIIAITMSTLKKISIPSAVKCIYSFLVENILPLRGQVQDLSLQMGLPLFVMHEFLVCFAAAFERG